MLTRKSNLKSRNLLSSFFSHGSYSKNCERNYISNWLACIIKRHIKKWTRTAKLSISYFGITELGFFLLYIQLNSMNLQHFCCGPESPTKKEVPMKLRRSKG